MEEASAACPYLEAVVGFMMFMYMFETYLDIRQYAALKLSNLPAPLKGVVSQGKFQKARAYSLDKGRFHFVHAAVNIVQESAVLLLGLLPWAWYASGSVVRRLGFDETSEVLHTLAFLAATTLWSQALELPFSLYSTFVIEARHGFNKQTIWLFLRDMMVGLGLMVVVGPPIVAAILFIVQNGGPYLALYLWGFMLLLSLAVMALYPILIAPLFNKFTPLSEGLLRAKIEKLAGSGSPSEEVVCD